MIKNLLNPEGNWGGKLKELLIVANLFTHISALSTQILGLKSCPSIARTFNSVDVTLLSILLLKLLLLAMWNFLIHQMVQLFSGLNSWTSFLNTISSRPNYFLQSDIQNLIRVRNLLLITTTNLHSNSCQKRIF